VTSIQPMTLGNSIWWW